MFLALDTVNNFSQMVTLLLIFIFVLAITYFTTKYIANYQKGKQSNANIRVIEGARITQKQFIQIVQIGEKYYALGIGKEEMTVICEIPKEELNLQENETPNLKFAEILSKFAKKDLSEKIEAEDVSEISETNDDVVVDTAKEKINTKNDI